MNIYESAEDYLEAMLVLQEKHGYIRSIDIANHLGVTKPSVSYAVKRLREGGYLTKAYSGGHGDRKQNIYTRKSAHPLLHISRRR